MRNIFVNSVDAIRFSNEGFVRKKMLSQPLISQLTDLYYSEFPKGSKDFYSSTFIQDIDHKKKLNKNLVNTLNPIISKYFGDYKVLGAQFLVKNPGDGGRMPFHQDWTIVDEEIDRSVTVWIPLNDTSNENGAIRVVPNSHEFSRNKRGPGNFDILLDVQSDLSNLAHTLCIEAGEALIFDQSLMHGSARNVTDKPRIAVAFGLVYKDAPLMFYHKKSDKQIEKYDVPDDFFITFSNDGSAPKEGVFSGIVNQEYKKVSVEEVKKTMDDLFNQSRSSFTAQPLFNDNILQQKFNNDGYVTLPLLNESEVDDLKKYYLSLNHDHIKDYGFHISLENENSDYRTGVFNKLFGTIMPRLDPLLMNYRPFTASYVIKEAGLRNIVPPHQDWSFVDESEFCSATVWIALMDVNKNNGALGIIKGSHKLFNYPRSSPSPQSKSILSDHVFNLFPFVEVVEMKAGEALIFNNKTIHASPPNISGITRIAAGIGITQKDAGLLHCYQTPGVEELVEVYEVEPSFFPQYNNSIMSAYFSKGEKPKNMKLIESFKKISPNYSKEEIVNIVTKTPGVNFNSDLMAELAEMYHYNVDGTKKSVQSEESKPNHEVEELSKKSFFKTYTPSNILAEIKHRMKGKSNV